MAVFHISQRILHPLECISSDIFGEFKKMMLQLKNWEEIKGIVGPTAEKAIKGILSYQLVGSKPRKIYKVKLP